MSAGTREPRSSRSRHTFVLVISWVVTAVGVGWFIWPFIGLAVDPDEPKLLRIFGVSFLLALAFLAAGSLIRLGARHANRPGHEAAHDE